MPAQQVRLSTFGAALTTSSGTIADDHIWILQARRSPPISSLCHRGEVAHDVLQSDGWPLQGAVKAEDHSGCHASKLPARTSAMFSA